MIGSKHKSEAKKRQIDLNKQYKKVHDKIVEGLNSNWVTNTAPGVIYNHGK